MVEQKLHESILSPEIYLLKNEISYTSLSRNEVISFARILGVRLFKSLFCYFHLGIMDALSTQCIHDRGTKQDAKYILSDCQCQHYIFNFP